MAYRPIYLEKKIHEKSTSSSLNTNHYSIYSKPNEKTSNQASALNHQKPRGGPISFLSVSHSQPKEADRSGLERLIESVNGRDQGERPGQRHHLIRSSGDREDLNRHSRDWNFLHKSENPRLSESVEYSENQTFPQPHIEPLRFPQRSFSSQNGHLPEPIKAFRQTISQGPANIILPYPLLSDLLFLRSPHNSKSSKTRSLILSFLSIEDISILRKIFGIKSPFEESSQPLSDPFLKSRLLNGLCIEDFQVISRKLIPSLGEDCSLFDHYSSLDLKSNNMIEADVTRTSSHYNHLISNLE